MTFFRSTKVDLRFRIATLSIAVREKITDFHIVEFLHGLFREA